MVSGGLRGTWNMLLWPRNGTFQFSAPWRLSQLYAAPSGSTKGKGHGLSEIRTIYRKSQWDKKTISNSKSIIDKG